MTTLQEVARLVDVGAPEAREALSAWRDTLCDDADSAVSRHTLGQLWARLGEFRLARLELERSLQGLEHVLEPDEPFLGVCLQSLGAVHLYGRPADPHAAMPLLRRALAIFSFHFGQHSVDVAEVLHHLARAHLALAQRDLAEPLIRAAQAIYLEVEGEHSTALQAVTSTLDGNQAHAALLLARAHWERGGEPR
jgi:tetratricopeptide (TPR) repeat protein